MRVSHVGSWPERQLVQRSFTIRWTHGCVITRLHAVLRDDARTRGSMHGWAQTMAEVIPQTGPAHVAIFDTRKASAIPRELWLELAQMIHALPRQPLRRALLVGEGLVGDNHAETAQLITAGRVRVFEPCEHDALPAWVAAAGTLERRRAEYFIR